MTSLATTHTEWLPYIAMVMGIHRDSGQWTATQSADADRCIRSGLRQFYTAHDWNFLRPILLLTTNTPYTTGTITVSNGVVTGSGTTFPSWATDAWLVFSGRRYKVAVRSGDTSLTLDNTDADNDAVAGTAYSLQRFQYDLPTDFGGLFGELVYDPGWTTTGLRLISDTWENLRTSQAWSLVTGAPRYYTIYPLTINLDVGQEWKIMFDPVPDAVYRFRGRYTLMPQQTESGNIYPGGDSIHAETILESILSATEYLMQNNPGGPHTIRYQGLLARSIEADKKLASPHQIPRRCRTDEEWRRAQSSMIGVYVGLTD